MSRLPFLGIGRPFLASLFTIFSAEISLWSFAPDLENLDKTRSYSMSSFFYICVDEVILQVSNGLGWALMMLQVLNLEATIGSLTAFIGLWNALMKPINYFKSFATQIMEEVTDMARLKNLMEEEPRIKDGDTPLDHDNGQIRLEKVSVSYPGKKNRRVVKKLSLTIEKGTRVDFVGPSGTGKSTLFKLLSRMLLPDKGRIFIGNKDITTLSKDS